jgi:hypothetical protein
VNAFSMKGINKQNSMIELHIEGILKVAFLKGYFHNCHFERTK